MHSPSVGIFPCSKTVESTLCLIEESLLLWEEDISSALLGRKLSLLVNASPSKRFTGSAVPPAEWGGPESVICWPLLVADLCPNDITLPHRGHRNSCSSPSLTATLALAQLQKSFSLSTWAWLNWCSGEDSSWLLPWSARVSSSLSTPLFVFSELT